MAKTSELSLHDASHWPEMTRTVLDTTAGTANVGIVHVEIGSEWGILLSDIRTFDSISMKVTVPTGVDPNVDESADHDFELGVWVDYVYGTAAAEAWINIETDEMKMYIGARLITAEGTNLRPLNTTVPYNPIAHAYIKIEQVDLGNRKGIALLASPDGATWTPLYDPTTISYDMTVGQAYIEMVDWGFVENLNGTPIAPFNIYTPEGFIAVATEKQPLKQKLPDGTWREFKGDVGIPLKQKQPDGSWKIVAGTHVRPPCPIRDVGTLSQFNPNDDDSVSVTLPFSVKIGNYTGTQAWVSNNGYVTFGTLDTGGWYTADDFVEITEGWPGVFVFHSDVDTRNIANGAKLVYYGTTTFQGSTVFVVNWRDVGYYGRHYDKLNDFQLVIWPRANGYKFELNYCKIAWDTGDASGGENGFFTGESPIDLGRYAPAAMGLYVASNKAGYLKAGSYVPNALLDSNPTTGLIFNSYNSGVNGRYIFQSFGA